MRTDAVLPVPNNNNSIDHKSIVPAAIIRSRQDVTFCDLSGDVARREFRCDTLEEYCATIEFSVKNLPLYGDHVTCSGNLNGEYSYRVQGYVCIAPGSSPWLEGIPYEVCYDQFSLAEYSVFEAMPQFFRYDFFSDGFSFELEETITTCTDNPSRLCACTITLEGQACNSCELCNDGRLVDDRSYYSFAVDCTNLASDLIRTCNATGWGDFYEEVEASLPFQVIKSNDDKNNSLPGNIPPANNNKSLSVAEIGGIIGACVALLLAGGLALTLWFLLYTKDNRRSSNSKNQNDNTSRVDDDRLSHVLQPPPTTPPLAQVLMVDHGALLDSNIDPTADASTPRYKDHMRV